MNRFYITTAIPYVNAKPHLGFALEIVQTDVFARYHRLRGDDVRFLTGTDDNSLSNVLAAEKEGISTADLVNRNAEYFFSLKEQLGLSFDDFIRTSSQKRHLEGARKLWEACQGQGDIYAKVYKGLYCVQCELFYTEAELIDGLCPEHGTKPDLVEEENYFFRLSKYAAEIERLIETDEYRIIPQTRKNEILSFIRMGLEDFSISRSVKRAKGWGVPVPSDETQVMYVWFDALSNYINALGFAADDDLYKKFWLENRNRVHVIGKGIIRFHAVYWPAMLLSAGIPLPSTLFVHGYITVQGSKMSKTQGNVVDPVEFAAEYGIDELRYYLLRLHPTDDTNFTLDHFVRTHNSDLADQLGNLLSRVVGMIERYYEGVVPEPSENSQEDAELRAIADGLFKRIDDAIVRFAPNEALAAVWALIAEANRYVVLTQPWVIAKSRQDPDSAARLATVLYNLAEVLRLAAWGCAAFLPQTSASIFGQMGLSPATTGIQEELVWGRTPSGTRLGPSSTLFPKIESTAKD